MYLFKSLDTINIYIKNGIKTYLITSKLSEPLGWCNNNE